MCCSMPARISRQVARNERCESDESCGKVGGIDASTERGRRQAERIEMIMVGTSVTGKGWKLRVMKSVVFLDLLLSNSQ